MLRGAFVATLLLAGLQAAVSSPAAATRAGGILGSIAGLADAFLDPTRPAIPDLTGSSTTTAASPASSPASTGPAGAPRHAPVPSIHTGGGTSVSP